MTQDGVLWERITPPLLTSEIGSGSWPTPTTMEHLPVRDPETFAEANKTRGGRKNRMALSNLREAIHSPHYKAMWPTPTTDSASDRKKKYAQGGMPLALAIKMWPTPQCDDAKNSGKNQTRRQTLASKVWSFPTPTATDAIKNGNVSARPGAMGLSETLGGQLNPTWVEWLMGWPLFWTVLDANAKPYYDAWHEAQQRTQASTEEIQSGIMRNVWWGIDPSAASQGRQPNQQREIECDGGMPAVPCENTLLNRELGAGEREAIDLQDLQGDIQTKADTKIQAMWQAGMPQGKRETIGRVAMGVKNRVDRLRCIGNGQVPAVAALAWQILSEGGDNEMP